MGTLENDLCGGGVRQPPEVDQCGAALSGSHRPWPPLGGRLGKPGLLQLPPSHDQPLQPTGSMLSGKAQPTDRSKDMTGEMGEKRLGWRGGAKNGGSGQQHESCLHCDTWKAYSSCPVSHSLRRCATVTHGATGAGLAMDYRACSSDMMLARACAF